MATLRSLSLRISTCVVLGSPLACGTDTSANTVGTISWSFDYADYTSSTVTPDPRDCSNESADPFADPYTDIADVRMVIVDPEGQVRGIDRTFDCSLGYNGEARITGIAREVFDITLEGVSADGTVLYSFFEAGVDFAEPYTGEKLLRTTVSEVQFTPTIDTNFSCVADVETFRYELFAIVDNQAESTATVSGTAPACDGGINTELLVRNIPVEPEPSNQSFIQTRYRLLISGLDGSGSPSRCGETTQAFRPGTGSLEPSINLTAGGCL